MLAVLTPVESEIAWSVVTIGFGIWKERRYVGIPSALVNLAGFLLVIASFDLPSGLNVLLSLYMIIGWIGIWQHDYDLLAFCGSKPYGALTLAIGLYEYGYLGNYWPMILIVWIAVAVISHCIMKHFVQDDQDDATF